MKTFKEITTPFGITFVVAPSGDTKMVISKDVIENNGEIFLTPGELALLIGYISKAVDA